MTSLVLVRTAVMWCLCWTSGLAQAPLAQPQQQQQTIEYAEIGSSPTLSCECQLEACKGVLWFRSLEPGGASEFLDSVNTAGRTTKKPGFKAKMKNSKTWSLQITAVKLADKGVYSCMLTNQTTEDVCEPGVLLLPGVSPPTTPPPPPPAPKPKKPVCSCPKNSRKPQEGCGPVVIWPLVGILAGLATALLSTLYYCSRLPKKCRHHLVKKRQIK